MIEIRKGDIFEQEDIDIILHQANCFCRMKSGIAKTISEKFPGAVEADNRTKIGDVFKLGSYTEYTDSSGKVIINMYGQYKYGTDSMKTDYLALESALVSVKHAYCNTGICKNTIGIPYGIGCGLAGGNWVSVLEIINKVFKGVDDNIIICKL